MTEFEASSLPPISDPAIYPLTAQAGLAWNSQRASDMSEWVELKDKMVITRRQRDILLELARKYQTMDPQYRLPVPEELDSRVLQRQAEENPTIVEPTGD